MLAQTAIAAAHEINQPLTALMGFAQLLLNTTPDVETQEDMLKKIYKAGKTIEEIVNKMETVRRFVAKPYVEGVTMIDLDAASQEETKGEQQSDCRSAD